MQAVTACPGPGLRSRQGRFHRGGEFLFLSLLEPASGYCLASRGAAVAAGVVCGSSAFSNPRLGLRLPGAPSCSSCSWALPGLPSADWGLSAPTASARGGQALGRDPPGSLLGTPTQCVHTLLPAIPPMSFLGSSGRCWVSVGRGIWRLPWARQGLRGEGSMSSVGTWTERARLPPASLAQTSREKR